MGQREDLLDGAKRCLVERGYAHTTARDITAASGANLGSIGYHFGSKEALMNEAMIELSTEAVERLREPAEASLTATWQALVDSFTEQRDLWTAVLESATQAVRFPDLRERLADAQDEARKVLGERLSHTDADAAGAVQFALIAGVMMQHLVAPERAPSAETIIRGLKALGRQPPRDQSQRSTAAEEHLHSSDRLPRKPQEDGNEMIISKRNGHV